MSTGTITAQVSARLQPIIEMCQCQSQAGEGGGKNAAMKANLSELVAALQAIVTALTTQATSL